MSMEGKIVDKNKYTLSQTVRCYDVDAQMRLRPSAFMDYAQEMAYLAAEAMGFGYEQMIKDGKAWVLSRLNFIFEDTPRWGEQIDLNTWHKGPSGPFYVRDFTITDPATGKVRVRDHLRELSAHEYEFFARVRRHQDIHRAQVGEFLHVVAGHAAEEGEFSVDDLVVAEREDEVFGERVADGKRELAVVVAAVDRVQLEIVERVVHPAHVPFEREPEAAEVERT